MAFYTTNYHISAHYIQQISTGTLSWYFPLFLTCQSARKLLLLMVFLHHFQTLMIIIRSIARIRILSLALAELLAIPVRAINPHKRLSLCLQHVLRRVLEPAVDEITMEAVSLADL